MDLNIPKDVNNIYFNFPQDFIVKINNIEISTSNANNNTNNNGGSRRYDDDDDDDDDDDWDDDDDDWDDDDDDDDYVIARNKSGNDLKLLNIILLLYIIGLI